jgi:preprotein translocase subunit SecG
MIYLFLVLIVIVCVAISFLILIQNPKGGGLAGNLAGFNTQFMGVKQTTDVLEKGTWVMAIVIALLCMFSVTFISQKGGSNIPEKMNVKPSSTAPASQPMPSMPAMPATPPPTAP